MKKITILLLLIACSLLSLTHVNASNKPDRLIIHYYRYDGDYRNFNVWMWEYKPSSLGGIQHNFKLTDIDDTYGSSVEIDLKKDYSSATTVGIIIKQGGWDGYREVGGDRFIDLTKVEQIGSVGHVYFVEMDTNIGLSKNDLDNHIPDYRPKVLSASFETPTSIKVLTTHSVTKGYELFENGKSKLINTNAHSKDFTISDNTFVISNTYELLVRFEDDYEAKSEISLQKLYDTDAFESLYTYEGTLGVSFENNQTIFRLWAPLSRSVSLNIYKQGHPDYDNQGKPNKESTPLETHEMIAIEHGAWEIKLVGDYDFKYYTFSVVNQTETHEVVDPYAYSTGANGLRGMIVNFNKTNTQDWKYNDRPQNITNLTDYIVYELHVRDLTSHTSWQGPENHRGKFLGLTDRGTTYTKNNITVTTGLDHMKELGINAVQLLPIFDFGYVDEVEIKNNPLYSNTFNWGYMPYNFNSLEGSYSTNPFDGKNRINEFKQAVQSLHQADIRVIMDVVYNHTGESASSNFHKILPGYYHRMNDTISFSNGSGTGNETASERSMMRKFMVDSVLFWAEEYNLSGFRFDLMALHDVETMNIIKSKLHDIDPTIIVYGEPWNGGETPLLESIAASKDNIKDLDGVGAFNDIFRDAVKGSVFQASEGGFIQGNSSQQIINQLKYGIVGGINYPNLGIDAWHLDPTKTINYVEAHDNNTLHDKLSLTGIKSNIGDYIIQANAMVLTSQGIPFLHAGVEFARSKPKPEGGYDENSYESPDSINQMRWDRKIDYVDVFEYYKTLISIRKQYSHFKMTTSDEIINRLTFLETDDKLHGLAYEIKGSSDEADMIIIHAGKTKRGAINVTLPSSKQYRMLTSLDYHDEFSETIVSGVASALPTSTVILIEVKDPLISINKSEISIKLNSTFDPLSNITKLGSYETIHATEIDTSKQGLHIVTLFVKSNYGAYFLYTYRVNVGKTTNVSVGGLS